MNASVFLDDGLPQQRTMVRVLKGSYPDAKPFAAIDLHEEKGSFVTLYIKPDQVLLLLEKLETQFNVATMEYVDKLDEKELTNVGD